MLGPIPEKKEFLAGLVGLGGGPTGYAVGGSLAAKTYLAELYSTYLFRGNEAVRNINTAIDMADKGGMTWIKNRDQSYNNAVFDTQRGATKQLETNATNQEQTYANSITSFNSNGFSLGTESNTNTNNNAMASFNLAKSPGFFTIVEYTGNGTAGRWIDHDLGSVPGAIWVKCTSHTGQWMVYHCKAASSKDYIDGRNSGYYFWNLDDNGARDQDSNNWSNTDPTATQFRVGGNLSVNQTTYTYIAYIFGGGCSPTTNNCKLLGLNQNPITTFTKLSGTLTNYGVTHNAGTPGSITGGANFNTGDYMDISGNADYDFGTGDFTIEYYVRVDSAANDGGKKATMWMTDGPTGDAVGNLRVCVNNNAGTFCAVANGVVLVNGTTNLTSGWKHVAVSRQNGLLMIFVEGIMEGQAYYPDSITANSGAPRPRIGSYGGSAGYPPGTNEGRFDGMISNLKVVKGEALYNAKFADKDWNLVTQTFPYDTSEEKYGDDGKQGLIRCGTYKGNGSSSILNPVNIGWEAQWILFRKRGSANWALLDTMRGMPTDDEYWNVLKPNEPNAETTTFVTGAEPTPTGFNLTHNWGDTNENGMEYYYIAIRAPDALVSKKPTAGTEMFALDRGTSSSEIPCFISGFPVDMAMYRVPNTAENWIVGMRKTKNRYWFGNLVGSETPDNDTIWDDNTGWSKTKGASVYSWMWKTGHGFQTMTWRGNGVNREFMHNLAAVPEMIWSRCLDAAKNTAVYHKGVNGGTNPEQYTLYLNNEEVKQDDATVFQDFAPTDKIFKVGTDHSVNQDTQRYAVCLFASIPGVSKVGHYIGDGTSNGSKEINVGFSPRYLLIKSSNNAGPWYVFDTQIGFSDDYNTQSEMLRLNDNNSNQGFNGVVRTATGFKLYSPGNAFNATGSNIIYYAHA